jgi:hypothetical protein
MNIVRTNDATMTTRVDSLSSSFVGHVTFFNSFFMSVKNVLILSIIRPLFPALVPLRAGRSFAAEAKWQARQESNLQPPVLETGALPN